MEHLNVTQGILGGLLFILFLVSIFIVHYNSKKKGEYLESIKLLQGRNFRIVIEKGKRDLSTEAELVKALSSHGANTVTIKDWGEENFGSTSYWAPEGTINIIITIEDGPRDDDTDFGFQVFSHSAFLGQKICSTYTSFELRAILKNIPFEIAEMISKQEQAESLRLECRGEPPVIRMDTLGR